ncbi:uncharacterized protein EDB93DRAFT_1256652 [Suillus bovinus]|uniref:uncharacterized protein n=1 Tax=Suillus bovinus TaxID=48563 RepID=UPI001B86C7AA|nr:uncharacterized protein EDB93DRAFT_1256652 [Suillus bovinus]KAG2128526.1 hypothetical protein EDB93DRAFT_1256652 [Suillus bovinus]
MMQVSEKTTLTKANEFSAPQAGTAGILEAQNHSLADSIPMPLLYFSDVQDGSHITAKFSPVLRAYVTSDYEETRGQVDGREVWSQDLTGLAQNTTWNLERNSWTGNLSVTHA